jgi:O-methyltransferase
MPGRVLSTVRRLVRAAGFDVVRYNELPIDLDAGVRETIAAVKPFTLTSVSRVGALCEAVRYLAGTGVQGAVVECGVWRGGSMMAVARTLLQCGDTSRHLYLFDTFQGMTAPTGKDVTFLGDSATRLLEVEAPADPESVWCIASLQEVRRNMQTTGYPSACVHYVEGRVEDTIPAQMPDSIALLRLDTDWYESTRHELEHLYPRLVKGGVLVLDDYGHWQGARQAVDEYFAHAGGRPLLHRIDYSGRLAIKVG